MGAKLDKAQPPEEGQTRQVRAAAALRVSNNGIEDISTLFTSAALVVKDPLALKWLDLSFNAIKRIPEEVCYVASRLCAGSVKVCYVASRLCACSVTMP